MKEYQIRNIGCDDTTVGSFELTEDQYEFLKSVFEKLNKHSYYACMPTIEIYPVQEEK